MSADPMRLIGTPEEWRDKDNYVEVCGNKHYLREFNMEERYLWRKVRDGGNLDALMEDFEKLNQEVREFDVGGMAEALEKRAEIIQARVDELIEKTPLDKWTEKVEDEINKLVEQRAGLLERVVELQSPKRKKLSEKSPELMSRLEALREAQGDIFLEMTWNLAKRECGEEREFEDYKGVARGSDRLAAQEVIEEGNFTWEAHNLNRSARRHLLRSTRSKS